MSNISYIVDNNKKFIKLVYMFFMYYYRMELKKDSFNIDKKITTKINEELKKRNLLNTIKIEVNCIYDSAYEIIVVDKDKKTWLFEIAYSNLKKIELVEVQKKSTNLCISNKIKESSLYIFNNDKVITKKIDLKNYELSKEEVDMLCLEHDIIISNHDIKNMVLKNPEILDFVLDYYKVGK